MMGRAGERPSKRALCGRGLDKGLRMNDRTFSSLRGLNPPHFLCISNSAAILLAAIY
jgi:hypothetical protein